MKAARRLVAKPRLAFTGKDGADRGAVAVFQLHIGVEEVPAEPFREQAGTGALAAAARTDEENETGRRRG